MTAGVCVSQSEHSADVAPLAVDVGRRLLLIAVKRRAGVQWRQSAKKIQKGKVSNFSGGKWLTAEFRVNV